MSRKRANKKIEQTPTQQPISPTKGIRVNTKTMYISIALVGIFLLCLFFNSFFWISSETALNPEGDTLATKYYLLGPDPYYNVRTITETLKTGVYPYVSQSDPDPMLNYPIGNAASRPPIFNMLAMMSGTILFHLSPLTEMDALGFMIQFLPALYGALLIFPVYKIGKELFGERIGIISALFVILIPIHHASGHGSSFALFDHDSFVLLLVTIFYYFFIKVLKEKDIIKGLTYASLAGVTLSAISLTWVGYQVILLGVCAYMFIFLYLDVIKKEYNSQITNRFVVLFALGYLIPLPYLLKIGFPFYFSFFAFAFAIGLRVLHELILRSKLPWILSIPITLGLTGGFFGFLWVVSQKLIVLPEYLRSLTTIATSLFTGGLYANKVSDTIAEASTYGLSMTVMSFGPALFWIALVGFLIFLIKTLKEKLQPEHIFVIVLFFSMFSLLTQAGRFINDLVPLMAIMSAFLVGSLITKIYQPKEVYEDIVITRPLLIAIIAISLVLLAPFITSTSFLLMNVYYAIMVITTLITAYNMANRNIYIT